MLCEISLFTTLVCGLAEEAKLHLHLTIYFTAARLMAPDPELMHIDAWFHSDQTRCGSCTYLLTGDALPL